MNNLTLLIKIRLIVLILILSSLNGFSQTRLPIYTAEAEDGVLSGVQVASSLSGFSGTGYVTGFDNSNDQVTVTVSVPVKAFYLIMIGYHSSDFKSQNMCINDGDYFSVDFQPNVGFTFANGGKHILNAGNNTITIQKGWGWTEIDNFVVYSAETNSYEKTSTTLVDPDASVNTRSVYNFLLSQYGKKIISGQFDNYFDELVQITGKTSLYRVWDFQPYTEGYPYLWKNGAHSFGIPPNLDITEKAIQWYRSTGKKGIVGFGWHWHSPSGGTVGTNTFYNESTTFDIKEAIQENSPNYTLLIRDIDAIAVELKKLEAANVPVIFRPLHEAGGGWFWWSGNKDTESEAACKKLYRIIFDRIQNYHNIHNLIWAWSTYEEEWYPGNDVVDIVGMDSYPGQNNYSTQKNVFDRYFELVDGEKIIAMTENGAIPDPDDCLDLDAPWSFFMSWGDMVASRNETSHLIKVFSNPRVITLENDTFPLIISAENQTICSQGSVTLEAEANFGTVNWFAEKDGGSPVNSGTSYTTPVISETTTYYVEASYNNTPSEISRIPVTVKIATSVKPPVITEQNGVLVSDVQEGNQWYFNNSPIENAMSNTLIPEQSGNYFSIATLNSCSSDPSNTIAYTRTGVSEIIDQGNSFDIYPNPLERGNTTIKITQLDFANDATVSIYDINGSYIQSSAILNNEIMLKEGLKSGIYVLKIMNQGLVCFKKLIVK